MTAPGIDACSSVPLYVEAYFGDQILGGATAFLWLRYDLKLSLVTNWHVASGRNNETNKPTHQLGGLPDHLRVHMPLKDRALPPLIVRVPTVDEDGEPLWVEHPNYGREVDVVSLEIDLPPPSEVDIMPMNAVRTTALKQRHRDAGVHPWLSIRPPWYRHAGVETGDVRQRAVPRAQL